MRPTGSCRIKDGVLYVNDFRRRFDYWSSQGWRSSIRLLFLADGIEEIPAGSFEYFENLEEIRFPSGLRCIGDSAFSECKRLAEIDLPEGLLSLGNSAFQGAEGARRVRIPQSLASIGDNALYFGDDSRLLSIDVNKDNPYFTSRDGVLYTADMKRLIKYPSAKRKAGFTVPGTVQAMADSAFSHSHYLDRIDLPQGLDTIESSAFSFCTHLEELTIPGSRNW
ncbi:MAG: leucine-rich repeat domain-containing protein [Firmicutes bacterium]|nr:leucine-rich repeat domain-containing protein [Bacillota bacterium]